MSVGHLDSVKDWVTDRFRRSYGIDVRSLALFRILVATVVLVDLLLRFRHVVVFYSDTGALPRSLAIPILSPDRWSILFLNGSPEFATIVLVIGIAAAACMMFGYRTRTATIVLWVVLVSVQTRNNHVLSGADTLMRLALFWGMFLPLGARWSIDASLPARSGIRDNTSVGIVASIAAFGLIFQNACVYLFTAIQKSGPRWQEEGTAVYYALGARDLSNGFGNWIFQTAPDSLFRVFTYGTMILEFAIPIMLLLPIGAVWLRGVAVALVILLHLGIALTMSVGLFPAISIASIMVVVPGGVWSLLASRKGIRSLHRSLQNRINSLLPNGANDESEPSARPGPVPYPYGREVSGFVQRPASGSSMNPKTLLNAALAGALVLVLMWNVSTVSSYQPPQQLRRITVATGLYQDWSMFAPDPQRASVWFVTEGVLASGERIDLMEPLATGDLSSFNPATMDQSDELLITDKYWRKYFHAIRSRDADLLAFAGYACRTWNAEHDGENRMKSLTLTRGASLTLPNSQRAEPALVHVGSWNCN